MAFEQRRMELVKGTVDANRAFAHTKYWVEEIGNRLDGTRDKNWPQITRSGFGNRNRFPARCWNWTDLCRFRGGDR